MHNYTLNDIQYLASVSDCERIDDDPDMHWDLIKIPQEDGEGGDIIRGKAAFYMDKI